MFSIFRNKTRERELELEKQKLELEKQILALQYENKRLEQEISSLKELVNSTDYYTKKTSYIYDEVVPDIDSFKEYTRENRYDNNNVEQYTHNSYLDALEDKLNKYSDMLGI
jgi:chromosome segregation ATPase